MCTRRPCFCPGFEGVREPLRHVARVAIWDREHNRVLGNVHAMPPVEVRVAAGARMTSLRRGLARPKVGQLLQDCSALTRRDAAPCTTMPCCAGSPGARRREPVVLEPSRRRIRARALCRGAAAHRNWRAARPLCADGGARRAVGRVQAGPSGRGGGARARAQGAVARHVFWLPCMPDGVRHLPGSTSSGQ